MKVQVKTRIKKWGNSLALRLPGVMTQLPKLKENMIVNVEISEDGLEIRPVRAKRDRLIFKESDLLKDLTSKKIHSDKIVEPTDKERGSK